MIAEGIAIPFLGTALGGLDSPSEGKIVVAGKDISTLTDNELADYRASKVGFVFQFYNLIPTLTVYENVALVGEISENVLDAKEMIGRVGLSDTLPRKNPLSPYDSFGRDHTGQICILFVNFCLKTATRIVLYAYLCYNNS